MNVTEVELVFDSSLLSYALLQESDLICIDVMCFHLFNRVGSNGQQVIILHGVLGGPCVFPQKHGVISGFKPIHGSEQFSFQSNLL